MDKHRTQDHKEDLSFMATAIELARDGVRRNEGGPFGAIIVKNGIIVGKGYNQVISTKYPTAHAEIIAIRNARPIAAPTLAALAAL
jgi:guanine deaminase